MSYTRKHKRLCWLSCQIPKSPTQALEAKSLGLQLSAYGARRHKRLEQHVMERRPRLVCQECGGSGEAEIDSIDFGGDDCGPIMFYMYAPCGYCEGIGYVTAHMRGVWLADRRHQAMRRRGQSGGH